MPTIIGHIVPAPAALHHAVAHHVPTHHASMGVTLHHAPTHHALIGVALHHAPTHHVLTCATHHSLLRNSRTSGCDPTLSARHAITAVLVFMGTPL
jgi:hypothetical protein